jgi:hypothetical protein
MSAFGESENLVEDTQSNFADKSMYSKVLTNRFYLPAPLEPIVSNNPYSSLIEYDNPNFTEINSGVSSSRLFTPEGTKNTSSPIFTENSERSHEVVNILQSKKEGSMEALATAY